MFKIFDVDVDAEATDGTTLVAGLTGAGPWTNADWDVGSADGAMSDGLAHKLNFTSAANLSGITLTLTGTDADGKAQTEALTGPNAGTVVSANYYKTFTALSVSSTLGANTLDVDLSDEVVTSTYQLDAHSSNAASLHVDITGTIDYDVQMILGARVGDFATPQQSAVWIPITAFDGKTADVQGAAPLGASAVRLVVNSYSTGAEAQLYIAQPLDH